MGRWAWEEGPAHPFFFGFVAAILLSLNHGEHGPLSSCGVRASLAGEHRL